MNILFVCSRNKWRSRTAEAIYKNHGHHQVKSVGTENAARIRINEGHLLWADLIFVMEQRHKERILQRFVGNQYSKDIIVLDIPDEYKYMDETLVEILKESIDPFLE